MKLGILGSGQLGRMLAVAAHDLGVHPAIYAPQAGPAWAVARDVVEAPWEDADALARFRDRVDVVTAELEHIPADAVAVAAERGTFAPSASALLSGRDRLTEKELLSRLGLPLAPFARVDAADGLSDAVARVGLPGLLKCRVSGYDGRGQQRISGPNGLDGAFEAVGGVPAVLEGWVTFRREVSLIAVRGRDGRVLWYPPVENRHEDGILRRSRVPVEELDDAALQTLKGALVGLLIELDYVGVLVIELFDTPSGWVVNEIAPRVHNSGHWTLEGAETSQFENHVRAVMGLPLGSPALRGPCAMVNLIGTCPPLDSLLRIDGARLHLYGKAPRPGRKIGHVTVTAPTVDLLDRRLEALHAVIAPG